MSVIKDEPTCSSCNQTITEVHVHSDMTESCTVKGCNQKLKLGGYTQMIDHGVSKVTCVCGNDVTALFDLD